MTNNSIKITSPNLRQKLWTWSVGDMYGRANSEPEAWRLAKDAEKLQKRRGEDEQKRTSTDLG